MKRYFKSVSSCNTSKTDDVTPTKKVKTETTPSSGVVPLPLFSGLSWKKISAENLDCDYVQLYGGPEASELFTKCENGLKYYSAAEGLTKLRVWGKWHNIPRKQVAYGDEGLTYTFSGITVPARPWKPFLLTIRERIQQVTGQKFNFVLVNRYANGNNYIGEHRDDEKDLVQQSPIASLSLGQHRDFVFRHGESRCKNAKRKVAPITLELRHGSLLMMNYPTNVYWYHSLPVRKKAMGTRVNMTFRCLKT